MHRSTEETIFHFCVLQFCLHSFVTGAQSKIKFDNPTKSMMSSNTSLHDWLSVQSSNWQCCMRLSKRTRFCDLFSCFPGSTLKRRNAPFSSLLPNKSWEKNDDLWTNVSNASLGVFRSLNFTQQQNKTKPQNIWTRTNKKNSLNHLGPEDSEVFWFLTFPILHLVQPLSSSSLKRVPQQNKSRKFWLWMPLDVCHCDWSNHSVILANCAKHCMIRRIMQSKLWVCAKQKSEVSDQTKAANTFLDGFQETFWSSLLLFCIWAVQIDTMLLFDIATILWHGDLFSNCCCKTTQMRSMSTCLSKIHKALLQLINKWPHWWCCTNESKSPCKLMSWNGSIGNYQSTQKITNQNSVCPCVVVHRKAHSCTVITVNCKNCCEGWSESPMIALSMHWLVLWITNWDEGCTHHGQQPRVSNIPHFVVSNSSIWNIVCTPFSLCNCDQNNRKGMHWESPAQSTSNIWGPTRETRRSCNANDRREWKSTLKPQTCLSIGEHAQLMTFLSRVPCSVTHCRTCR